MRYKGPHKAYGLYAHVTWHTWRRQCSVSAPSARVIAAAVLQAAHRHNVNVLAQAVLADHIHLLVSYRPDTALAGFIRDAKSESSRRANEQTGSQLKWCRGYYAGSVSHSHIPAVRVYIAKQYHRHPDRIPARAD